MDGSAAHADGGVLEAPTAFARIHTTNMRHACRADGMIGDDRQRAPAFRSFFEQQAPMSPTPAARHGARGVHMATRQGEMP